MELWICEHNVSRADCFFLYSFKLFLCSSLSIWSSSFLSSSSSKSFIFWLLIFLGSGLVGSTSCGSSALDIDGSTYFQIWLVFALRLITSIHSSQSFRLARITV